ncbi:MAG: autotransporter strand-loop-strand O-heptosyltransferase [Selenomonadaceae bacterium]|nr:autotransporter strand-loop-strand O-heptosyltransferase [Selenomonadaceae bacterium]
MQYPIHIFYGPKLADLLPGDLQQWLQPLMHYTTQQPITGKVAGLDGVLLDFNVGLRLQIPEGNWQVKIRDGLSGIVFFDDTVSKVCLVSAEKFFVPWEITLSLEGRIVFQHQFSPEGQNIYCRFASGGLGDHIALFPYMEAFRRFHDCQVFCSVAPYLQELVELYYPEIVCVKEQPPEDIYATYYLAPSFNPLITPEEMRTVPMEFYGRELLGLPWAKKRIYTPTKPRQIQAPYVCIAVQASNTAKAWLNPQGWSEVVRHLKNLGYRVLCIDKNREEASHGHIVRIPQEAEDFTGNLPLSERVNLLAYADFFIGLSSGLAWLAWTTDIPVILIGGIVATWFEFATPYRVINRLVCHGCHNDTHIPWPTFETCPHHKGTPRAYECSKQISAKQVIEVIERIRAQNGRVAK